MNLYSWFGHPLFIYVYIVLDLTRKEQTMLGSVVHITSRSRSGHRPGGYGLHQQSATNVLSLDTQSPTSSTSLFGFLHRCFAAVTWITKVQLRSRLLGRCRPTGVCFSWWWIMFGCFTSCISRQLLIKCLSCWEAAGSFTWLSFQQLEVFLCLLRLMLKIYIIYYNRKDDSVVFYILILLTLILLRNWEFPSVHRDNSRTCSQRFTNLFLYLQGFCSANTVQQR